jgi:glycosyltransferase involved in cell wall biosynthesis
MSGNHTTKTSKNLQIHLPTVSIIMPSHNRKASLERALLALAAQTYPMELLELVLVLDGCSDGSAERVEELRTSLPYYINLLVRKQGGPAAARNSAVKNAKGEILLFIDDDIVATPLLVTEHVRLHLEDDNAVVLGPMATPPDHIRPLWVRWEEHVLERQYQDMINGVYEPTARQFYTGNGSVRRHWFIKTGEFDEDLKRAEDIEFAYRLVDKFNLNFYFNPAAVGYHYANRSFESWKRAHYLYGRYDVVMDRDKGHNWVLEAILNEFQERDFFTRQLAPLLVNRMRVQRIITRLILSFSQALAKIGQFELSYKGLSFCANLLYLQGMHDEIKQGWSSTSVQNIPLEVRT